LRPAPERLPPWVLIVAVIVKLDLVTINQVYS
jgi:hypothetical protein